jgi:hypothetical protein
VCRRDQNRARARGGARRGRALVHRCGTQNRRRRASHRRGASSRIHARVSRTHALSDADRSILTNAGASITPRDRAATERAAAAWAAAIPRRPLTWRSDTLDVRPVDDRCPCTARSRGRRAGYRLRTTRRSDRRRPLLVAAQTQAQSATGLSLPSSSERRSRMRIAAFGRQPSRREAPHRRAERHRRQRDLLLARHEHLGPADERRAMRGFRGRRGCDDAERARRDG